MRASSQADVLSDLLRAVRLSGAVYFDFELRTPWVVEAPPSGRIFGTVKPGAQRLIEYHLVVRGTGWGHAAGRKPLRLGEGDLIVFSQGDAPVLSGASARVPMCYEFQGRGPERARMVGCILGCDQRPFHPLLAALPPVIHLPAAGPDTTAGWLGMLLHIAVQESTSGRAGAENVLARLSELVFVETIRRSLEALPAAQTGWLAGWRDPQIGQALAALHREPCEPWTVERLARVAGLSRSVLAERFTVLIGQPPMQYLALWRMHLASRLLLDGWHVASVAGAVGYESEAAFSRAFKKLVGCPPATWRRDGRAASPSSQVTTLPQSA